MSCAHICSTRSSRDMDSRMQTYRVKGCPYCGAEPVLFCEGVGRDKVFILDCLNHPEFPVRGMWPVEYPEGPEEKWALHSDMESVEDLISHWNIDDADPELSQSRFSFDVTLSTR